MKKGSNFKLLAIRPLENCHERFTKNLTPGEIYKFYNDYNFEGKNGHVDKSEEVLSIHYVPTAGDIYSIKNTGGEIDINISAVVGKNGSGKSTLVELLFAVIYVFSFEKKILEPNEDSLKKDYDKLKVKKADFDPVTKIADIKEEAKAIIGALKAAPSDIDFDLIRASFKEYGKETKKNERLLKAFLAEEKRIEDKKEEIDFFKKELKAEIFYQISNTFFRLTINSGIRISIVESNLTENDPELAGLNGKTEKDLKSLFNLSESFFYTIAVNYSHYALNANYLGDWINSLFHKNDGYKTPVVINPMRDNGNFDINKEIAFAKYRLLSNLLIEKKHNPEEDVYITDKQFVSKVRFTLNKKKVEENKKFNDNGKFISGESATVDLVKTLYEEFYPGLEMADIRNTESPYIMDIIGRYIIQKFNKIIGTYEGYHKNYTSKDTLRLMLHDNSHITFKLKQAVNFLGHNARNPDQIKFIWDEQLYKSNEDIYTEFTPSELLDWMGNLPSSEIITHLPPSIFDIEFYLSDGESAEPSTFNELSSGEQQLIHTVQSVTYHINNLLSVHSGIDRVTYRNINIIYDEIELYFHPDYQRKFISELLKAINRLNLESADQGIQAINILFLTHSPFILSDIPSQNIMLLCIDEETKKTMPKKSNTQTFAANVHDLIADSFFLDTSMGEFAEKKITDIIEHIKKNELTHNDEQLIELIGDSFLKSSIQEFQEKSK